MIRQKKYIMNDYLEAEIFNASNNLKKLIRAKKVKESAPAQKKLNNDNSKKYFIRVAHLNFNESDLSLDLTFDKDHLPGTRREVYNCLKNYLARLRYRRKKLGLGKLKYLYVISDVDESGNQKRYHVHMLINNIDRDIAESLWNCGTANTDRLQFNEYGITGKTSYIARQGRGEKTWQGSTGLIKPEPIISDKAITMAIAERMARNPEDRGLFEKLYPGWTFTDCEVKEDLINGRSFFIRMRKYGELKSKRRQ